MRRIIFFLFIMALILIAFEVRCQGEKEVSDSQKDVNNINSGLKTIDSLLYLIDNSQIKPCIIVDSLEIMISSDTIIRIEVTSDNEIIKYRLRANNKGHYMDGKFIDIVEFSHKLIYAIEYYSRNKYNYLGYYYLENEIIGISPPGMRPPTEDSIVNYEKVWDEIKKYSDQCNK